MKKILSLGAMMLYVAAQASEFKPTDLVLPQGVSYTLGPVTLTRVLETATSANKSGTTSSEMKSEGASEKKLVGTTSESGCSSRFGTGYSFGGSIGGSSGGSGGFSLSGLLGINLDIGGKISSEDSNTSSSTSRNGSERSFEKSHQSSSGSSSEFTEVEQYGGYHLKFTVVFKSKDLRDTFLVGGSNAWVILNGFSSPVHVLYREHKEPVQLRAEERPFFFDYPIDDQLTLKDAKRFVKEGRRNAVTLSLIGDEFPVVSESTRENVLSEITRMMEMSPNTVVSVDFGDVKRLSPWRVKQKYPKASGKRGQRVTVREALDALNDVVAEDDEMPEKAFAFASSGEMTAVCDTPAVGAPRKGNLFLVAFSTVANTEEAESDIHLPTENFLARRLSDYAELHLVKLSLREVAQAHVACPDKVSTLVNETEEALEGVEGGKELWKSLCDEYQKEITEAKSEKVEEKPGQQEGGHRVGETMLVDLGGGVKMEFCWCPPGEFSMGSPSSESGRDDDENQYLVKITNGFWMAKTEVTQQVWRNTMGNNPSQNKGPDLPVEYVSWDDCQEFIKNVRKASGYEVRLPTEAEWEYACRAGSTGAYHGDLEKIAWYENNSESKTHPVGSKDPNAFGLHDMSGNVCEWCQDWYGESYYGASSGEDPQGPVSGNCRVNRGGGWRSIAKHCRSADRGGGGRAAVSGWSTPNDRSNCLGFRLACSAGPSK